MTLVQAAYRAGCVVAEIDSRFSLTPTTKTNACGYPGRLPVYLRHVWAKALAVPEIIQLLDGWECPDRPFTLEEQGPFWVGFYHQKTARELPADFGGRLKTLRERANMTGQDLADATGLSRQRLHQLESGTHRPRWDEVQAIAEALGVPTDTFRDR